MNKNYYDILQINVNASPEIIEKAYKTLAKKYHPDLQPKEKKEDAEQILKEINEAYEILSAPEKRHQYDIELKKQKELEDQIKWQNSQNRQNVKTKEQVYQPYIHQELQKQLEYKKQMEYARQKAYHDAYIQDLKNRGYKIRYKKTIKDYIRGIISIIVVIFILFLLWQIPFVRNYFISIYNDNKIIHLLIDSLINIFRTKEA